MFNVRVYGLWVNSSNEILVVKEKIKGLDFVKYPGGGLEFGEGVLDCMYREWKEETGMQLLAAEHFYTTDFYVQSAFNPKHQIISIYYLVQANEQETPQIAAHETMLESFTFHPLESLDAETLSFPIDKHVTRMLKTNLVAGKRVRPA